MTITQELFEPSIELSQIESNYKPQDEVGLLVKLTDTGTKHCLENRYLHKGVQKNKKGESELSMQIDKSDIAFTADFFLLLGKEAKVLAPIELVALLKEKTNDLRKMYL